MPLRHATLRQLRTFDAVARHQSFTRAAAELHLTVPAVSIQIRQLAEAVGQPLTEQIGRKFFLTPAGQVLARGCRDLVGRLDALGQELSELQGLEKGRLAVAILTSAKYLVPRLLGEFCERHPGVEVALFVGNREALLERLANNQDDLYVLGQMPRHEAVVTMPFAENLLVMVAPREHPLALERAIPPARLADYPFILREQGSGTRRATEEFFRSHGVALRVRMELGSNEAIKQSVMAGLGVAMLSLNNLRLEIASGDIVALDVQGLPLTRHWHAVYPRGKKLSWAARAFLEHMLESSASVASD